MTTIKNDQLFTELQQRPDMNFEFVNETLCRMVEPTPLTETATFPCVVRLIQDDSPMGRYNQSCSEYRHGVRLKCCLLPIIATHIAKNGIVNDSEWDFNRYEIIGYPVVDGSAEWAWYQMMQGKQVTFGCEDDRFYALSTRKDGSIGCYIGKITDGSCYENGEDFVADSINTGWRLYEPKPEPAFKVGDWVECNGKQRLIEIVGRDLGRGHYYHFKWNGGGAYANSIIRKLDQSEVIVHIGCLSGVVRYGIDDNTFVLIPQDYDGMQDVCIIAFAMLDTPTRELVESLLKAQEET